MGSLKDKVIDRFSQQIFKNDLKKLLKKHFKNILKTAKTSSIIIINIAIKLIRKYFHLMGNKITTKQSQYCVGQ